MLIIGCNQLLLLLLFVLQQTTTMIGGSLLLVICGSRERDQLVFESCSTAPDIGQLWVLVQYPFNVFACCFAHDADALSLSC